MRLDEPRLPPLEPEEMPAEIRERFGDGPMLNIFRTLAPHPDLMKRWLVFGTHVLGKNSLSPRDRELSQAPAHRTSNSAWSRAIESWAASEG